MRDLWMILMGRGGSDTLAVWLTNAKTAHCRWMQRYLQRRGWVVMYLPEESRECRALCWLKLYKGQK